MEHARPPHGEIQEGLACYSPQGHKELDMTTHLNNSLRKGEFYYLTSIFYDLHEKTNLPKNCTLCLYTIKTVFLEVNNWYFL